MPIYEFYCDQCHIIFNFYSSRVQTTKVPSCPKCDKKELQKQISQFATIGKAKESEEEMLAGLDESKMERAFQSLMQGAEHINEDDPRQMASLMRKFTRETGVHLGDSMEEAISRMEAGEDPEQVETEMGAQLNEDDFSLESLRKNTLLRRREPLRDEKLYEM